MNNFFKLISSSPLFYSVSTTDIESLLKDINYKVINLIKNEYIFDTFTTSTSIGLVLSGHINVEKVLSSGKSVFMYAKKRGDIFGEVAAFSETKYYPCNVISMTKSSLIIFHKNEFLKLLTSNETILNNFLKILCDKTFYLNKRIGTLSFTSAKEKVVYSILNDFDIDDNLHIHLPFNKQCWADTLNISRASLYRELHILCNNSLIFFDKSNMIKILNINKLEETIHN